MSSRANSWSGHLAAAGAYAIFGFNIIFCKDIAQSGAVTPIVLFTLRAIGATALFWALSLFLPRERVSGRELLRIALASFLGLFVPQLTFLAAIGMTTSIDAAVLSSLTPVYTMCFAFLFLGEPITGKKVTGVAVSLLGVLLLIFNSVHDTGGPDRTRPLGVLLMALNGLSFAGYLGAFRPLISRPAAVTPRVGWEIAFVIVFATFVAYFLIPLGQKRLRPTLVSMYSYLQPMIAAGVSIAIGMDAFTWQKALAALLVFGGVALVSRSRAASA